MQSTEGIIDFVGVFFHLIVFIQVEKTLDKFHVTSWTGVDQPEWIQGNKNEHENYSQARGQYEESRGTRLGWNLLFLFFVF